MVMIKMMMTVVGDNDEDGDNNNDVENDDAIVWSVNRNLSKKMSSIENSVNNSNLCAFIFAFFSLYKHREKKQQWP